MVDILKNVSSFIFWWREHEKQQNVYVMLIFIADFLTKMFFINQNVCIIPQKY